MIEVILWLLLAVVMYFAGRYDLLREIESGVWEIDWVNTHSIRLCRSRR